MKNLILASASPRRKKLLERIGLPFKVQPSAVDESVAPGLEADQVVQKLALRKAKDIARNFKNALIVGADTIVVFERQILLKPSDAPEAKNMLQKLSGKTHQVYTGVGLCKTDGKSNITDAISFIERTDVTFGDISPKDIDNYVAGGSPMDKAGGYGIQDDFGAIFVKRIEGDYYNVVGFPLHSFYNAMNSFAPEFLAKAKPFDE